MPRFKIEESVGGELMIIKAKNVKLAITRFINFLPVNPDNKSWNFDILVENVDKREVTPVAKA